MAFDKKAELIASGMTEGEADYMISGGTKTGGLPESYVQGDDEPRQTEPAPQQAAEPPAGQQTQQVQPGADDDDPEPPRDSPFYRQWHQEKRKRQGLESERQQLQTERQQLLERLAERDQQWARADERLRLLGEAMQPPPAQPQAPPDREADPFGYMAWQDQRLNALEEKLTGVANQTQEDRAHQALRETYVSSARDFARQNPDFGGAYNFLMQMRDQQLAAVGISDPQRRMAEIVNDERHLVAQALQSGQNPAAVIYNLAKAGGYRTPAAAPAASVQPNGAAPTNGAHAPANGAPSVTEQVQQIQRGQAASRSLSSAGGAPVPQGIDINRLIDMTEDEYAHWKAQLTPAQRNELRSLMGAPR